MVKPREGFLGTITVLDEDGSGTITASNARIRNVTDPALPQDAATKNYVDAQVTSANEWSEVLSIGNVTDGYNPVISAGDQLEGEDGSDLVFATTSGGDTVITSDGYEVARFGIGSLFMRPGDSDDFVIGGRSAVAGHDGRGISVLAQPANASGAYQGGGITLAAGDAINVGGGAVSIDAGHGTNSPGGDTTISSGSSGTDNEAASISLTGADTSSTAGGSVTIAGGGAGGGPGGNVHIASGTGNVYSSSLFVGASIDLIGGNTSPRRPDGYLVAGHNNAQPGGWAILEAGVGSPGGNVLVTAGESYSGDGGDIVLSTGNGAGGSSSGSLIVNSGPTTVLTLDGYVVDVETQRIVNAVDPVSPQDVATKHYVDGYFSANNEWSEVLANGASSGGTSPIISTGDEILGQTDVVIRGAFSDSGNAGDINLYGGATNSGIGGDILLYAGPSDSNQGGTVTIKSGENEGSGPAGDVILQANVSDSGRDGYIIFKRGATELAKFDLNGYLDVLNNRIVNVADPVGDQDAATKSYVDGYFTSSNEWSEVLANGNVSGGTNPEISAGDRLQGQDGYDLTLYTSSSGDVVLDANGADGYIIFKRDGSEVARWDGGGSERLLFTTTQVVEFPQPSTTAYIKTGDSDVSPSALQIQAGTGNGVNGGVLNLYSGSAVNGVGGQLRLIAGSGTGTGSGGNMEVTAGDGYGSGGSLTMRSGHASYGSGGNLNITAGNGTAQSGYVYIAAGSASGSSAAGDAYFKAGVNSGTGTSGGLQISGGRAYGTSASSNSVTLESGQAGGGSGPMFIRTGQSDNSFSGGIEISVGNGVTSGGSMLVRAGTASAGYGGTTTVNAGGGSTYGGHMMLNAGSGGSSYGGSFYITAGSSTSGAPGDVYIKSGHGTATYDGYIIFQRYTTEVARFNEYDQLKVNANRIVDVQDPVDPQDAATKHYVDGYFAANNQLSEILANGNTTDNYDIVVNGTSQITLGASNPIVTDSTVDGRDVSDDGYALDLRGPFFNGCTIQTANIDVTSDGYTVTLSLEQEGGGDLTIQLDNGFLHYNAGSVSLSAGTDTVPSLNYVYIQDVAGTATLLSSTTDWPVTEYAPVASVLVQSATGVQEDGCYKVHDWTDHIHNTQGHLDGLNYWIRRQNASWQTGVVPTTTISVDGYTVDFAVTSGEILQLHVNTFPAIDTDADGYVFVVNDGYTPYDRVGHLSDLLTDSQGGSMSNKYFSLVIWGVVAEDTADAKLMCNLPSGSYTTQDDLVADVSRYTDYTIPSEFRGAGFLIAQIQLHHDTSVGGEFTEINTIDLRGQLPSVSAGGQSVQGSTFSDANFRIFDNTDSNKQIRFEAINITSGQTREITMPDQDVDFSWGSALSVDNNTNGTDAEIGAGDALVAEFGGGSLNVASISGSNMVLGQDTGFSNLEIHSAAPLLLYSGNTGKYISVVSGTDLQAHSSGASTFNILNSSVASDEDGGNVFIDAGTGDDGYDGGSVILNSGAGGTGGTDGYIIIQRDGVEAARWNEYNQLDVNTNRIVNVANPVDNQDAATKQYVDGYFSANNEWSEVLANGNVSGGTNPEISNGDQIQGESGYDLILATYGDGYTIINKDDAEVVRFDDLGSPRLLFPFAAGQDAHIKLANRTTNGAGADLFIEGQDALGGGEEPGGNVIIITGRGDDGGGSDGRVQIKSPKSSYDPVVELGGVNNPFVSVGGIWGAADSAALRDHRLEFYASTSDVRVVVGERSAPGTKATDLFINAQRNSSATAGSDGGDLHLQSGDGTGGIDGYVIIDSGTQTPIEIARFGNGMVDMSLDGTSITFAEAQTLIDSDGSSTYEIESVDSLHIQSQAKSSGSTGTIGIFSGANTGGGSGYIRLITADVDGGDSGSINLETGDSSTGASGTCYMTTGAAVGGSGSVYMDAGTSSAGQGGHGYVHAGDGYTGGGLAELYGGDVIAGGSGTAGTINIYAGDNDGYGGGGHVNILAGEAVNGAGGDANLRGAHGASGGGALNLSAGNATSSGLGGSIYMNGGSGTDDGSGYVQLSCGATSAGYGSGFSINAGGGSTYGGDVTISAGAGSSQYGGDFNIISGVGATYDGYIIFKRGTTEVARFDEEGFLDVNANRIVDVQDPVNPQDAATKHYVDSTIGGDGYVTTISEGIITTDSGGDVLVTYDPGDGSVSFIDGIIVARGQTSGDSAGWKISAVFEDTGGTLSQIGSASIQVEEREDTSWEVDIGVTGSSITVDVIGDAAEDVSWRFIGKVVEGP